MALGGLEWVLIALAVIMLFGAKRIPELARGIGQGITEFRQTSKNIKKESDKIKQDMVGSLNYESDSEEQEVGKQSDN